MAAPPTSSHNQTQHIPASSPPADAGDGEKNPAQFTVRALIAGAVLGAPLAAANLYTLLKIGWSFGVNVTACVLAWALWRVLRPLTGGRLSPLTMLENVTLQTTASAAGYATGPTAAIAFGALLLITGQHPRFDVMFAVTLITAIFGVLLAIPLKRWLIDSERLPFPSGAMAAEAIRGLYERSAAAMREARALFAALFVGVTVGLVRTPSALLESGQFARSTATTERLEKLALLPSEIAFAYPAALAGREVAVRGFGYEPSFLLVAAGMMVGLRIALSMLLSAAVLYFVLTPLLFQHDAGLPADAAPELPDMGGAIEVRRWSLWGGTGLLLSASVVGFLLQLPRMVGRRPPDVPTLSAVASEERHATTPWSAALLVGGILLVYLILALLLQRFYQVPLWVSAVGLLLAAISAIIAARATGETDTTPTGPVTKLTQIGVGFTSPGNLGANVLAGAVAGGAGMSAADLLQDMKTGSLLGANTRRLIASQLIGAVVGTAVIVPVWFALFPSPQRIEAMQPIPVMIAAGTGQLAASLRAPADPEPALPAQSAPAADADPASSKRITERLGIPPWSRFALNAGLALGALLALIERVFPASRNWLPSAVGLGMGWIFPFSNVLAFGVGAAIAAIWTAASRRSAEQYRPALASGVVAGESLVLAGVALFLAAHYYWVGPATLIGDVEPP